MTSTEFRPADAATRGRDYVAEVRRSHESAGHKPAFGRHVMSNVFPPRYMQVARLIRRYGRRMGATEEQMRSAIKAGIPLLSKRTPESIACEHAQAFRASAMAETAVLDMRS